MSVTQDYKSDTATRPSTGTSDYKKLPRRLAEVIVGALADRICEYARFRDDQDSDKKYWISAIAECEWAAAEIGETEFLNLLLQARVSA